MRLISVAHVVVCIIFLIPPLHGLASKLSTSALEHFISHHINDLPTLSHTAFECIEQGELHVATLLYRHILSIWPNHTPTIYNLAHTLKDVSKVHEAIKYYEQVIAQEPSHTFAHLGLAQSYLVLGDFAHGLPGLMYRHPEIASFPNYNFNAIDLSQHTVLIRCEWGFGDIFQFIRYAQLLKERGAQVIVQSYKELVPLLSLCPYIDQTITEGDAFPYHTIQIPLLSLPEAFGTTLNTIPNTVPYLYANEILKKTWKEKLSSDSAFKIGICWSGRGNPNAPLYVQKNIPLAEIARIAELENVSVYSLQINAVTAEFPLIKTFDENFDQNKFMDTAAVMHSLDLIITLDSSIAHLAGGLGRPVWVLLPYTADWRWMSKRTDSPWYPTMRLFRQEVPGDWKQAIDQVIEKLTYLTKDPRDLFKEANAHLSRYELAQAEQLYKTVLKKLPTSLGSMHNLAYALRWQGKLDEAIDLYKREIEFLDKKSDGYFGLAQSYLLGGNFKDGLPAFELGRQDSIGGVPQRLTSLDNIKGKNILILAEWGFGDAFQFVRYAQLLKAAGATVMVQTYPELERIMKCCPYIDHIVTTGDNFPVEPDAQIPLLSLPYLFDTTLETIPAEIPYFYADKKLIKKWGSYLKDDHNMRIGICWHGSTTNAYPNKNIPLKQFEPLLRIPGITFYSLQKIHGVEEFAQLPEVITIHHFGHDFDTTNGRFMDTAAVMLHMDLIITVDTSIAHLAGALGIPVWVALPQVPDWRWMLNRNDTPWYPTMTLFRQKNPGSWTEVIRQITEALKNIMHKSE